MASVPNISHPAGLSVCRTIWTENTDSESTEKGFESKITDFTGTKCEACIQKTKCRKKTTLYSMSLLWTLGNNCWGSGASRGQTLLQMGRSIPPLHYRGHGEAALQKKKKELEKKEHGSTHFLLTRLLARGHNTSACKLPLLTRTGAPVVLSCQKKKKRELILTRGSCFEFYDVELKDWGREIKSWFLIKGVLCVPGRNDYGE